MHNWDDARIYQRACIYQSGEGIDISYIASAIDSGTRNINALSLRQRTGWRRRIFSSFEAYRKASKIKADIYHFHDPDLLPWMFLLRLKGKKVIYDIHENFYEKFNKLPFVIKQMATLFYSIYELPIYTFSGIVTVSESLAKLYTNKSKKTHIVLNVPPLDAAPELVNQNGGMVNTQTIYVSGQQSDKRNVKSLIQSSAILKNNYPDHKVHLVGRYVPEGYDADLMNLATKLGVAENLKLEGMLPWKENFARTSQATVGCVFYEDNPNNRVGIPNRIFEYMACGVPIIAEDFYELRKIVNYSKCGILVDSTKPEEVAKAISQIFDDPVAARKMGASGKESVISRYNYNKEVINLITYYQKILDDGRN